MSIKNNSKENEKPKRQLISFTSKTILIALAILIFSPLLTYLIILFIQNTPIKNLPHIGSVDTWISFAGSIIGGSITMVALALTINYESEARKKEELRQIKPVLVGEPIYLEDSWGRVSKEFNVNGCIEQDVQLPWMIKNVSNNIANNLSIIREYIYLYNTKTNSYDIEKQGLYSYGITMLQVILDNNFLLEPNSYQNFNTNFKCEYDNNGEFMFGNAFNFLYVKKYSYTDVRNIVTYENLFKMELNINIDVDNKLHLFIGNYYNEEI